MAVDDIDLRVLQEVPGDVPERPGQEEIVAVQVRQDLPGGLTEALVQGVGLTGVPSDPDRGQTLPVALQQGQRAIRGAAVLDDVLQRGVALSQDAAEGALQEPLRVERRRDDRDRRARAHRWHGEVPRGDLERPRRVVPEVPESGPQPAAATGAQFQLRPPGLLGLQRLEGGEVSPGALVQIEGHAHEPDLGPGDRLV
jgi:hypothetical protein